jgi:hypothetical protein
MGVKLATLKEKRCKEGVWATKKYPCEIEGCNLPPGEKRQRINKLTERRNELVKRVWEVVHL